MNRLLKFDAGLEKTILKTDMKEPCNQCPFRRNSPPGWLGPWNARDLLFNLSYHPFPCHATIESEGQSLEENSLQGCAGAAIYLNNKYELSRDVLTAGHQKKLKNLSPEEKGKVFRFPSEFLDYHDMKKFQNKEREFECQ